MPRDILQLKSEGCIVFSMSSVPCMCFLMLAFTNEWTFSKMPLDLVGGEDSKPGIYFLIQMQLYGITHFLIIFWHLL